MRVLSGIQPSGQLHLGNYLGSIKPNLEWASKAESFFFIADLHALTTLQSANELSGLRKEVLLDYLACGFDPDKATLYYQSQIPEHTELMWILATVTPMGLLERAVSYKDKTGKGIMASVGLFTYPVLMTADILLYDANIVPVGQDQKQHLEIARDIAVKFNIAYGETFVVPEPEIRESVAVVPGTDGQKMSKSYGNTIPLFAEDKEIEKAIMGIVTDSKGPTEPKDPDSSSIFKIHKLLIDEAAAQALGNDYRNGIAYGDAKKKLLQTFMDYTAPMRQKRLELLKHDSYLKDVAEAGRKKAATIAEKTMERVRKAVGLR